MTIKEKLNILEELLDIEKDALREDANLEDIEEWDSIAVISTIAMLDSYFGKIATSAEIKNFKTIKNITDIME